MFETLKSKVVAIILKNLISKYFDDLKVKGYKLSITQNKDSYIINAELPKNSIDNLVNKVKG